MNPFLIVIALVAAGVLVWWLMRLRQNDAVDAILKSESAPGRLCTRAHLIDGGNHIAVALALDPQQISYRNGDFAATVDIDKIDEIEYGSDLVTGGIADGAVLRLRAHGRAIEFVLDVATAERWSQQLPPHLQPRLKTA
jgi:hypothetical protein